MRIYIKISLAWTLPIILTACTPADLSLKVGSGANAPSIAPGQAPSATQVPEVSKPRNRKPIIQAFTANPNNVAITKGDKITFSVVATDEDADQLAYAWDATKGVLSTNGGQTVNWSPQRSDGSLEKGTATISVIINDGKEISTASLNIQIEANGAIVDQTSQSNQASSPEAQAKIDEILKRIKEGDGTKPIDSKPQTPEQVQSPSTKKTPPPKTETNTHRTITGCNGEIISVPADQPLPTLSCAPNLTAPGNIQVSNLTGSGFSVTWSPVSGASSYRVYLNGQTFDAGTNTSYVFSGLGGATTYNLEVEAVSSGGQGIRSGSIPTVTHSPNPVNVATNSPTPYQSLNPGSNIVGSIQQGQHHYYALTDIIPGQVYNLSLYNLSGDLDLFEGPNSSVSASSFDFSSTAGGTTNENITFTGSSNPSYAAVYGYQAGNYTIKLTLATNTPQPIYSPTSDISVVERATFGGSVFTDDSSPFHGQVMARSLNSAVYFDAVTTTDSGGNYAFNNAPTGVQLEITASKSGFATRRRVEVLQSNAAGSPTVNRFDFGTGGSGNGSIANAVSDKPEVTVVTPGRNASGVSQMTSFVLKFSEPMDRATVQDNFEIRAYSNEKLNVDTSANTFTLAGSGSIDSLSGMRIWDKRSFNISWNSDDTEATFTFKEERYLPTDKDSDRVPDYQVSLNRADGIIKDKSGISRGSGQSKFKLTEGAFEQSYRFSISTDTTQPRLESIIAQTAENSGVNSDGDAIKVRFSERMIHYTLGPTIAGGMGGLSAQAAAANNSLAVSSAAANYRVTVIRAGTPVHQQVLWSALGGRAIFDVNDPTHKTAVLLPPNSSTDLYKPGDNVQIIVDTSVCDPAGNTISPGGQSSSANAS